MECICRICLSTRESPLEMVDIFDPNTDTIANIYTMFTSLPAESFDGLSKYICEGCHQSIVDFQIFRALCIQSYNILSERKLIKREIEPVENDHDDPEYDEFECDIFKCELPDAVSEPDVATELDLIKEDNPKAESDVAQAKQGLQRGKRKKKPKRKGPTENVIMICDICQKGFRRKFKLEGHMREHRGLKPFQCDICENKQFTRITKYNEHMDSKHNVHRVKKVYKCDYDGCEKSYHIAVIISNKKK